MGETPKSYSIHNPRSKKVTLKDFIINGGLHSLSEVRFRDTGQKTTRYESELSDESNDGMVYEKSPQAGRYYSVVDISDRAPWAQQEHPLLAATVKVKYSNGVEVWTYLHERFNDVVSNRKQHVGH